MSALLCRIELSKKNGIVITVNNESGNIKHTIVLDNDSITTTSKGNSSTSTIKQTPDSVTIDCKTFKVTADKIECTSNQATKLSSGTDFSISGGTTFTAKGNTNATLSSTKVDVKGQAMVNIQGAMIKLQ
ncbi:hypothetical protein [Zooshikella ganghwensis]|uniref:hypothetical protein n=1 Tax=Zooshikella ganghwensis TaxID=202772 RepID=UPI0003F9D66D|nr:hypothetical protein [Zooshikella ganghwensis]